MKNKNSTFLWQLADWPQWRFDIAALAAPLAEVSRALGFFHGRLVDVGTALRDQISVAALTKEVVSSSEIEGESLSAASVRSSIAYQMGIDVGETIALDRRIEGLAEMILDATVNSAKPVDRERLFGWHAALFSTGYSGRARINVGRWRDDVNGSMQVVSGPVDRQRIHYEAPPADRLDIEIHHFVDWINKPIVIPHLLKAGLGHLWFVTLHPFDDGNGRVGRTIGELLLTRADGNPQRFYSLSAQILRERKSYYEMLEQAQKGTMDVTEWLLWFLQTLHRAVDQAQLTFDAVLTKARFWQLHGTLALNERQINLLNRMLDDFEEKVTTKKWADIAECSQGTALRDITDLLSRGLLKESGARGRSTSYELEDLKRYDFGR